MSNLHTPLRYTSLVEALSYLVLAGVAMPIKYIGGNDVPVRICGMVHGVLFLLLLWLVVRCYFESPWPKSRLWTLALASLVPLVPFFLDKRVRAWIAELPVQKPE
jgi:integral membrane protein